MGRVRVDDEFRAIQWDADSARGVRVVPLQAPGVQPQRPHASEGFPPALVPSQAARDDAAVAERARPVGDVQRRAAEDRF